jgi:hypothetical protein
MRVPSLSTADENCGLPCGLSCTFSTEPIEPPNSHPGLYNEARLLLTAVRTAVSRRGRGDARVVEVGVSGEWARGGGCGAVDGGGSVRRHVRRRGPHAAAGRTRLGGSGLGALSQVRCLPCLPPKPHPSTT